MDLGTGLENQRATSLVGSYPTASARSFFENRLTTFMARIPNTHCVICSKPIYKRPTQIAKGNTYCSRACYAASLRDGIHGTCRYCGKPVYKQLAQASRSKSGALYCNRRCATSENNKVKLGPRNGNYKNGIATYRKRALDHYGAKCHVCDYSNDIVLEVHHIDRDRENNELSNLVVLCPTHHSEVHLGVLKLN